MLTTIDLIKKLRKFRHFGGVFPYDKLPLIINKPKSIVINLDPSYKDGSHWVGVNFDKYGRAFYFDSFGRPPQGNILTFIEEMLQEDILIQMVN